MSDKYVARQLKFYETAESESAQDNALYRLEVYFITAMKVETITYKRVKNLGNYQSETFEATATVEEGEEAHIVASVLKNFVYKQLYPPVVKEDADAELLEVF